MDRRTYYQEYYQKNKEKMNKSHYAWVEKNREYYNEKRRERYLAKNGGISRKQIKKENLEQRYNNPRSRREKKEAFDKLQDLDHPNVFIP